MRQRWTVLQGTSSRSFDPHALDAPFRLQHLELQPIIFLQTRLERMALSVAFGERAHGLDAFDFSFELLVLALILDVLRKSRDAKP